MPAQRADARERPERAGDVDRLPGDPGGLGQVGMLHQNGFQAGGLDKSPVEPHDLSPHPRGRFPADVQGDL